MTANPKVLPLTRLLNDLHKPVGVWPPYVTTGRWTVWSDQRDGKVVYVGKLRRRPR